MGVCKNGSSVGICTRRINVFARFVPIYMLSWYFINKISASELSRKFIKSALLVGTPTTTNLSNGPCQTQLPNNLLSFPFFFATLFLHVKGVGEGRVNLATVPENQSSISLLLPVLLFMILAWSSWSTHPPLPLHNTGAST